MPIKHTKQKLKREIKRKKVKSRQVMLLTLVKLPLHAFHLGLISTHPVDPLCAQPCVRGRKRVDIN